MNAQSPADDPAGRLLVEVAQLRARTAGRDRLLARVGAGLMAAGPVIGVAGYFRSSMTNNPLYQNDASIIAVIGLTVAVVGTGLFVRYSFGEFLRFWMARLVAQQQSAPPVPPMPKRTPTPATPAALPQNGPEAAAPLPPPPEPPRAPAPHRQEAT